MKPVDVYLSLGSNQGDRQAMLDEALRRLDAAIGRPRAALSSVIETPAWGFDGPAFLNCVVRYRTARQPHTLLRICKRIERAMGAARRWNTTPTAAGSITTAPSTSTSCSTATSAWTPRTCRSRTR